MGAFDELMKVNVNPFTEQKKTGGATLTYLSWPHAWSEVKKRYPDAEYEIEKFGGLPYVYDPMTGYMVYTKVTIEGITHEMWLPVMDGANKSMKAEAYTYMVKNQNFKYAKKGQDGKYYDKYGNEQPEYFEKTVEAATMFDVNKAVMRCLVKNLAMFGLGLYIYAGEDLPIESDEAKQERAAEAKDAKDSEEVRNTPLDKVHLQALLKRMKSEGVDKNLVWMRYGIQKPEDVTYEVERLINGDWKEILKECKG